MDVKSDGDTFLVNDFVMIKGGILVFGSRFAIMIDMRPASDIDRRAN